MKNLLFRISLLCLVAASFVGCDPEGESGVGNFNLKVKTLSQDYVELSVTAPSTVEMAYVIGTETRMVTAPVLFMTGKTLTVSPGQAIVLDETLQSNTTYYVYAAAKLDDQSYSDVVTLDFTTETYNFNNLLTVLETKTDGYKIHISVPESVKKKGHVIRYSTADLATYNVIMKERFFNNESQYTLTSIVANGNRHGNFVKNDSTLIYDNSNVIMLDENGEPILDENGEQIDIHNPISPGEPIVYLAGECRYGSDEEMGAITGFYYGVKDYSYQVPMFDWSTVDSSFDWSINDRTDYAGSGWTGAFQKLVFNSVEPGLCEETVEVDIPEDGILVTDATIRFTMDEGVSRYFYMILDDALYNQMIDLYLDMSGAPQEEIDKALQWFLSSYTAFRDFYIGQEIEDLEVMAGKSFAAGHLEGETTYHVLCTIHVDDPTMKDNPTNAAKQNFVHKTFKTKKKELDPPVIEVKPVNTGNPFAATFNIKSTGEDLIGAYWACNYAREFELMFNTGATYATLLNGNYTMEKEEIDKINSPEGLELTFPVLDGEVMRFAIYGCNAEYTFNDLVRGEDGRGHGWNDYKAPMAPPVSKIESPLYEALAGDWTATARIKINEMQDDGTINTREMPYSSKVTISNDVPNLPLTLGEDVYKLYKEDKDEVDGMYEELLGLSQMFTDYRLAGQNRMLCTGFIDFDYYKENRVKYMSPYDLFASKEYNSWDVPQIIYDFGPKWFLQILEGGEVIVPMDSEFLPPMHAWPGYPYYVGGYGTDPKGDTYSFYDGNENIKGFPVEISPNMDKITIKPIVVDGCPYYMNALGVQAGSLNSVEIVATVLTEIELKKGWNPKTNTKAVNGYGAVPSSVSAVTVDGAQVTEVPKLKVYKSITEFKPAKQYKVDETPNVVTMDMIQKSKERILKQYDLK